MPLSRDFYKIISNLSTNPPKHQVLEFLEILYRWGPRVYNYYSQTNNHFKLRGNDKVDLNLLTEITEEELREQIAVYGDIAHLDIISIISNLENIALEEEFV